MRRGKFIVFEGIDGTGKTTQCQKLSDYLTYRDINNIIVKMPSSRFEGQLMKYIPKWKPDFRDDADAVRLLALATAQDLSKQLPMIEEALSIGVTVICDRYVSSAYAYSSYFYNTVEVVSMLTSPYITPDMVLFINTPVDMCLARIGRRRKEISPHESREVLSTALYRYSRGFDFFDNLATIDGTKSIRTITDEIRRILQPMFNIPNFISI